MNIFNTIRKETMDFTGKTAVIEGDSLLSYGRLFSCADMTASSLRGKGVARFHRVGLLCGDSIDYLTTSLAVLSLSAVIVPISPDQADSEIRDIIERISLDYLIFERGTYHEEGSEILPSEGLLKKELRMLKRDVPELSDSEYYRINPAFIRFSSGTTGASKGVVLSHEAILDRTDAADKGLRITSEDTVLWVLSMSFHFVVTILLFLRRAATIVLCGHGFPESLIEGITNHKGTFIYASPFHYNVLARSGLVSPRSLSNIRMAVSTAMKLPEAIAVQFSAKFGFELAEAYGIIEVGLPFLNLDAESRIRGSVGRPLPDYEVKIFKKDSDGVGEIYIKGKGMLDAYFSPWQIRKSILKKGWFKTGDLGRINSNGHLTIVGRKKDVINFVGMKVFPFEVESVLNEYPLVKESMVYGVSHPQYGQLPIARLVLKNGAASDLDLNDLRRFCYHKMSQYKVPKDFQVVDALPITASGKVKRENTPH
ncbi:MAG: fatty acid--CoA ligase family protein [Thermodesulfovibrionales bacterium]|nr:fatty acid--CoA ligase family protein [Thermodesulfovibrionales bacterium]